LVDDNPASSNDSVALVDVTTRIVVGVLAVMVEPETVNTCATSVKSLSPFSRYRYTYSADVSVNRQP
jgi:hypothetical protein